MQFGVFMYGYSTNIGDEIQSLAASGFLPRIDRVIERDRLHWYGRIPGTFVIFNGWFLESPRPCWPPPDTIHPLFVSFHPTIPRQFIAERFAQYYKQYEPIGCRSIATVSAFETIGVEAYFSGCLTLTLERRERPRTGRIFAVDVDMEHYLKVVPEPVRARASVHSHEYPPLQGSSTTRLKWYAFDLMQRAMNKVDTERRLFRGLRDKLSRLRHETRTKVANQMLDAYAGAKLVITSRLHCALPCLALGTPVILLRQGVRSDPRFAGLRDFVRCHNDMAEPLKFNWDNPEPNSDDHRPYAEKLKQRCRETINEILKAEPGDRAAGQEQEPAAQRM